MTQVIPSYTFSNLSGYNNTHFNSQFNGKNVQCLIILIKKKFKSSNLWGKLLIAINDVVHKSNETTGMVINQSKTNADLSLQCFLFIWLLISFL
jgi:hypothetical protein